MIFNGFGFLFVFLPLVLAAFFMPGARWLRPYTLIGGSLIFYAVSGIEHAVVLCADVLWVYFVVTRTGFRDSRLMLAAAVILPSLALGYYKYLTFLLSSLFDLTDPSARDQFSLFADILVPAGISFFTFQVISFAIDRHRGDIKEIPSLSHFAAYIMLFPQLVAGPILRYRDVAVSIRALQEFQLDKEHASRAVGYICVGLGVKVLIADTLSHYLAGYGNDPGGLSQLSAVYTIFAYSFQIYFDFYGYSLIAIGLGTLFGFAFPQNFNRPYEALNPRDFWRRWHITLSLWIRDYLYIPLGGNRSYLRNIFIVMSICGLWHGAGWSFVVWGLYHGCLVVGYRYTQVGWDCMPAILQRGTTFVLISLGWLLFLFDFDGGLKIMSSLAGSAKISQPGPDLGMWTALAVAALLTFAVRLEPLAENRSTVAWRVGATNIGFSLLFVAVLLFLDRSETFIYFRF